MNTLVRRLFNSLLVITGLGLIVGGLITRLYGAVVVGILLEGVNANAWLRSLRPARPTARS